MPKSWLTVHHAQEAFVLIAFSGLLSIGFSDAVLTGLVVDFLTPIPVPIIAPMVIGVAIGLGVGSRVDPQLRAIRSLLAPRIIWAATLLLAGCGMATTASVLGDISAISIIRNCLIFGALGILATVVFGPVGSWIGPSMVGLFLILFGGARPEGLPAWAFVLQESTTLVQLLFALSAYAGAACLYAYRGNRHVRVPSAWT